MTASVDEGDDGADDPNHGEIVSTFTRETELTGCEKGQATAAVARGDVDPTADDLDDLLAPYLERCDRGDDDDEADEDDEAREVDEASGGEAVDWKTIRDEGRVARDEARQAFVDACGDDDDEGVEGDDLDGDDDEMSPECAELHAAAKQAHEDWKAEWHAARDAAKGSKGHERDVDTDEDENVSAPSDEPGPPDHAKGNGKKQADQSSGGKGKGASKGKGKP